jgi:hypothetical protein
MVSLAKQMNMATFLPLHDKARLVKSRDQLVAGYPWRSFAHDFEPTALVRSRG